MGRNAFAHEAGIHQDGMLKDRRTYEIMRPEDVGVPQTTLVLGKHSGRHAVQKRCEQLGLDALAPRPRRGLPPDGRAGRSQKHISDDDLLAIAEAVRRACASRGATGELSQEAGLRIRPEDLGCRFSRSVKTNPGHYSTVTLFARFLG